MTDMLIGVTVALIFSLGVGGHALHEVAEYEHHHTYEGTAR